MTNSNIQKNVMRRVRVAYFFRPVVSGQVLALALAVLSVWGIGHEVFVAQVIANMPSVTDVQALIEFFAVALINTTVVVQLLVAVTIAAFAWMTKDTIMVVKQGRAFA